MLTYRLKARLRARKALWAGFLLGLSGPAMLFAPHPRAAPAVERATSASAWRSVDGYIRRAADSERVRAQKARFSPQAKRA